MAKNPSRKKPAAKKASATPASPPAPAANGKGPTTSAGITRAAAKIAEAVKAPARDVAKKSAAPVAKTPAKPSPAKPVIIAPPTTNTPAAKEIATSAPISAPVISLAKPDAPKTNSVAATSAPDGPLTASAKLGPVVPHAPPAKPTVVITPAPFIPVAKQPTSTPGKPVTVSAPTPVMPIAKTAPKAPVTKPRKGRAPKIDLATPAATIEAKRAWATSGALQAAMTSQPRRVLFIASECTPLAQTGGLGDVVAGLSKALVARGHDARIIMPLYASINRAKYEITYLRSCCIHMGRNEEIWVGIYQGRLDEEVPVWFVDYERYFGRPWLYDGSDEDGFRFGVLSKAAMQLCKDINFIPHVMHLHDWMSAPVAVFLKSWDRVLSPLSNVGSVLTLHNIGYQGKFHRSVLDFYGLGSEYFTPDRFEDYGAVNLLKAGVQYADMITTVSPSYAREIKDSVGGMGLGMYINDRGDRVRGILNGVDTELWNPETDKYLPVNYSVENLAGKAACKKALQERLGLEVNPHIPIFGMVSRFAPQKGFDLIRGALPQAMRDMVIQVVALGSGDPVTEDFFRWLQSAFPRRACGYIGFSPELAHLIEAGSDFFIMPSYYEPCGLNQMYSSLYGTLPIVRATGGLDDTVDNYNESTGDGTGFKFWDPTDRALFYTIGWAVATYFDRPHHYSMMQRRGMHKDFSWVSSARQYEDVYERAIACHV